MNRKWIAAVVVIAASAAGGWLWASAGAGASAQGERVQVVMYQNPACGCCGKWAQHMQDNGFDVEINKTPEINRIKEREGIDATTASCHTAFVDGYVIEGHVPAADVQRLLRERPDVKGLTVPGMPMGSPGMEGDRSDPYDVLTFDGAGNTSVWSSH